jgi:hypothetical protein
MVPAARPRPDHRAERLRPFDEATARQRLREAEQPVPEATDRSWKREDLYTRGGTG